MARWYCVLALFMSVSIISLAHSADDLPEPAKQDLSDGDVHHRTVPTDTRSRCRKLWEFITFRHEAYPRHCQECLAYPQQTCVPPVFRFMENRYPTVTNP